jgi:hypothetical protein
MSKNRSHDAATSIASLGMPCRSIVAMTSSLAIAFDARFDRPLSSSAAASASSSTSSTDPILSHPAFSSLRFVTPPSSATHTATLSRLRLSPPPVKTRV